LARYPNPISARDAPPEVRWAVDHFLGSLVHATQHRPVRSTGEATSHFTARLQEAQQRSKDARELLDSYRIDPARQREALRRLQQETALKRRGLSENAVRERVWGGVARSTGVKEPAVQGTQP
jgi:hypothetical protein